MDGEASRGRSGAGRRIHSVIPRLRLSAAVPHPGPRPALRSHRSTSSSRPQKTLHPRPLSSACVQVRPHTEQQRGKRAGPKAARLPVALRRRETPRLEFGSSDLSLSCKSSPGVLPSLDALLSDPRFAGPRHDTAPVGSCSPGPAATATPGVRAERVWHHQRLWDRTWAVVSSRVSTASLVTRVQEFDQQTQVDWTTFCRRTKS